MQNEIPDIFKTQVVAADADIFWQQDDYTTKPAKDTLVVSLPFPTGSEEEQQLVKMLSACKMGQDDYHVVQLGQDEKKAWHQLRDQVRASKVLLLGVHPQQLGINALMRQHDLNHFDGVQFIPTASLTELCSNAALKQHLWTSVFKVIYF